MGKQLTSSEFDLLIKDLEKTHIVIAPKRIKDGGRFSDTSLVKFDEIHYFKEIVWDTQTYLSAKDVVFPTKQAMFHFVNDSAIEPTVPEKRIALFCRACDIHGILRLDNIFLGNGDEKDPYYEALRNRIDFIHLACQEAFESCFCTAMNTSKPVNHKASIQYGQDRLIKIESYDAQVSELLSPYGIKVDIQFKEPQTHLTQAHVPNVNEMPPEIFNHPIWEEYARRCISCGRCNTSCPTCSCFSVFDTSNNDGSCSRCRYWDGCHLNGFTNMAGGIEFRKDFGSRMRFKVFHKLYDYKKKFGENMCVGCGRCEDVCPEYISYINCINKLNSLINGDPIRE